MTELTANRTLVKSPPELWAECSDAAALGRHLDKFGDIRITRLEPETAVAWEGDRASGTVRLEPSGWGTKVVLTAQFPSPDPEAAEGAQDEPAPADPVASDPVPADPVPAAKPLGLLARIFGRLRHRAAVEEPEPAIEPPAEPEVVEEPPDPPGEALLIAAPPVGEELLIAAPPAGEELLIAALDSLGQAHHRPFSRS